MENSELFKILNEQMTSRIDKLEAVMSASFEKFDVKLDRLFSERNAICQAHNKRLDDIESDVNLLQDRQERNEERSKRHLTILGVVIAFFSVILNTFFSLFVKK